MYNISKEQYDKWFDIINYWEDVIKEYAERYDGEHRMYEKYDKMIEDMYNATKKKPFVYVVSQIQPTELEYNGALYACSTFEKAQKYARQLNKEYGSGCVFDKNWDFVEYNCESDPHYYTVTKLEINEPIAGGSDD